MELTDYTVEEIEKELRSRGVGIYPLSMLFISKPKDNGEDWKTTHLAPE